MVSCCCGYCFPNALLDISIHFLDRSDHKDMMEETGDSQQSGYNQCTVCCTRPRCALSQGAACLGLGAGDGADRISGCPWAAHCSSLCKAMALHMLTLFLLVIQLLAFSLHSIRGLQMLMLFLLVIQLLVLSLHSIRGLQMPPHPTPSPQGS